MLEYVIYEKVYQWLDYLFLNLFQLLHYYKILHSILNSSKDSFAHET
jgi:hypothetical protein